MITEPAAEQDEAARRRAVLQACDRFLSGRPVEQPREVLAALAEATPAEETADHYGDGDLVRGFEQEVAALLGKEDAVFFPTGTMAQQVALRIWSERKGSRNVAFHPTCHLEIHEQKAYERLHGLHAVLVGERHTLMTVDDLEGVAEPIAALLLELPQREIGGQLPDWDALQAQIAWAHDRGAAVHMDGARLWESAPFYGREYAEIAAGFDSVYVSFYKTLGALAGAMLAGPGDFIGEARVWRRRHGGELFHFYPYVLAARIQLRDRLPKIAGYCERASALAAILRDIPGVAVKPDRPHTNMMHVYLKGDAERLASRAMQIAEEERVLLFSRLRPADVPGWHGFELAVADHTTAFGADELRGLFERVLGVCA